MTIQRVSRKVALGGLIAAAAIIPTACSESLQGESRKGITAATTCSDYITYPGAERQDAAIRISTQVDGVSNPGNPMWALSLDAACGSSPSLTLGEYFDPNR